MKAVNFAKRLPGLASIAVSVAMLSSPLLGWLHKRPQPSLVSANATPSGNVPAQARVSRDLLLRKYEDLPLSFEVNHGQADSTVKFLARGHDYSLCLSAGQAVLKFRAPSAPDPFDLNPSSPAANPDSTTVRMKLVGSDPEARITALDELPGRSNYFIGNDPKNWRTNVTNYARVRCQNVYPGVDMVYYGSQYRIEYDFELAAGANPEAIRLSFDGAEEIQIDEAGGFLKIATQSGDFLQHKPFVYQQVEEGRRAIACEYVMNGNREVGFEISEYDRSKPLTIDPVLSYSSYLGGRRSDGASGIAVDAEGNAYVTGSTGSDDFPDTRGGFQKTLAGGDAFVTKINSSGTAIIYSTYLGGSDTEFVGRGEQGLAIAVDQAGSAYLTGETSSSDFPTTQGALRSTALFDPSIHGNVDAFVTRLNATGNALIYSTYLGGLYPGFEAPVASTDIGLAIAVDSEGSAYVAGQTNSADFPVANALQPTRLATDDAFVTKLNPTGTALIYSTYLGGDSKATSIAVDADGNAYVAGTTSSASFPVTANAFQSSLSDSIGSGDVFVTKLDHPGTSLMYSTYLGGRDIDEAAGIAIDNAGNAFVTGHTRSIDFPTLNAIQPSINNSAVNPTTSNEFDAFVSKLNASGTALVYSTYLGGRDADIGNSIAVDAAGNATLTGRTSSNDFLVKNALQSSLSGGPNRIDAFITRLTPTGALSYSTFFGGKGIDEGRGVALDAHGNAYVAGDTTSRNLLTQSPLQAELGGQGDGFIIKISLPRIIAAAISGKKLIVSGEGFAEAAVILLNGEQQKTKNDERSTSTILIAKKAGRIIPPGQSVLIQVRNPDGALSNEFNFVRSIE